MKTSVPHLDVYFRMSLVQSSELLEVGAVCVWLEARRERECVSVLGFGLGFVVFVLVFFSSLFRGI